MARRKSNSIPYGGGQYRAAANGRGFDCRITVRGARRYSRQPDERAARTWLDAATADTPLASPITRAQMLDAQEALAKLPPGMTLSKLADNWLAKESREPITTADAVERFLDNRGRRVKHVTLLGYRSILLQFAAARPGMLADITPRNIDDFVSRFGRVRHNSALAHIKVFLTHCVRDGLISSSPAVGVKGVRATEPPKGILAVQETEALLRAAEATCHKAIPYLALGLFAGIRPGELARITADAIRGDYILLAGADTKTADARTIRIRPNLARWFIAYPPDGRIAHLSTRRHYRLISDIRKAAGVENWPSDCMRHSFATYAYEAEKDAAHIAAEMGHHGTAVFYRHYRALALPGDGEKFFSICPRLGMDWERR